MSILARAHYARKKPSKYDIKNTPLGSIKRINILFTENLLENPVSKLFYFGDKKSSIHFHTKAPI